MKRVLEWLGQLPSTNARIAVTLCIVALTGLVYLVLACIGRSWEPSDSWLVFLATMSGIDGAVHVAKRLTQKDMPPSGGAGTTSAENIG